MLCTHRASTFSQRFSGKVCFLTGFALLFWISGCGSGTKANDAPKSQQAPQSYFAPSVAGTTNGVPLLTVPQTYTLDDTGGAFSQTTYSLSPPVGPQVINAGGLTPSSRGLLSLTIAANYTSNISGIYVAKTFNPPQPGSFAVELAGQAGGLVQLAGQPVAPLVAAVQCPNLTKAQPYQFVTIPAALNDPKADRQTNTWVPTLDTAYGSVEISSSGSTVNFANIHQSTLPSVGGTGVPAQPSSPSVTGACAPTFFGNTITLPYPLTVTNPGSSSQIVPPSATVGIGPTGLLVEDNGANSRNIKAGDYQNALGAGTGAVGLPQPSSLLDTNAVVGAQYLGFVYGTGKYSGNPSAPPNGWSSHLVSFGFATKPANCPSVAASTTVIYGGDFTGDVPTSDGYGNCNLAIDLGSQSTSSNGLYPNTTVSIGAGYAANTTKKLDPFSAVAIAGQLNGKYAIFVIGLDSTQAWGIYLLQSN